MATKSKSQVKNEKKPIAPVLRALEVDGEPAYFPIERTTSVRSTTQILAAKGFSFETHKNNQMKRFEVTRTA